MTEQIKSAIKNLKEMYPKKCKMVDGRFTGGYDDYESEKGKSITLAIRSLKAWSEVLQELEKKNALYMSYLSNKENPYDSDLFGKHIAVENCIDIINQKLAEIEEVR